MLTYRQAVPSKAALLLGIAALIALGCSGGHPTASLTALAVTPALPDAVPAGFPVQLVATGTYSDGSTADLTASVTWSASNQVIADFVTPTPGELSTCGSGTTDVTATDAASGVVSPAVTVTLTELSSILVSPIDPTLLAGASLQLSALGADSGDADFDVTSIVIWTSSNEAFATVSPGGVVTAIGLGTATITAMDPFTGRSATSCVTVSE